MQTCLKQHLFDGYEITILIQAGSNMYCKPLYISGIKVQEQSDLCPYCLPQYLNRSNYVSKNMQQMTLADGIFRLIFAGTLRINLHAQLTSGAKGLRFGLSLHLLP